MEQKRVTFSIEAESKENIRPILNTYESSSTNERVLKARLDKWLWAARFFKTRALARLAVERGLVVYDGQRTTPGREVEIGATIEIQGVNGKRSFAIKKISTRRHNNDEANLLFDPLL